MIISWVEIILRLKEHILQEIMYNESQKHLLKWCTESSISEVKPMKIYKWRLTMSTQNNACSQHQVPPQAKNIITLGQYNP